MSKTLSNRTPAQHKRFARITARQIPQLNDETLAALFCQIVGRQYFRTPCYVCDTVAVQHAALRRKGEYHAKL
jgi:hypothetical protein